MTFIGAVLVLVFGAKRLPELGSGLGRSIREFKGAMRELSADATPLKEDLKQITKEMRNL